MQNLSIKTAKFVSVPAKSKTLVASVLLPLPENKGTVFGLIKVLGNGSEERQRLLEIVIEHLERFQSTSTEHINIPRRFEQILQSINENIAQHIEESSKIPITDFHAVIGVNTKHQLFLSGIGSLSALFMHRTAKQRYSIYELDKQLAEGQSWQKPFMTVLDGEMHPGDVFYLATRVGSREISPGDLQDILVTLPPSGALKRIQQHLHRDTAYGGLALKVTDKETTGRPKKINPLSSMEQINKTKDETSAILGEQSPDVVSGIKGFVAPIIKNLSAPGTKGPKTVFKRLLKLIVQALTAVTIFIISFSKKAFTFFSFSARKLWTKYRNRKQAGKPKTARKEIKESPSIKDRLTSLPPITKYVAGGAALILVIFIITISVGGSKNEKKEDLAEAQLVLERIEEKKNAAEASLIYNDTEQAKTLVDEATSLLASISVEDEEINSELKRLDAELAEILESIRGAKEVAVTSIASVSPHTGNPVTSAVTINGTLHVTTGINEVLSFNELEQTFSPLTVTTGTIGSIRLTAENDGNFLFVDSDQSLGRADLTNLTLNPITSGVNSLSSVEDITTYNNNLYALSKSTEQIIKMQPQALGYDAGTNWITSADDSLEHATSLTIDGDIYVLAKNNIFKFTSGKQQPLNLGSVEPVLQDGKRIQTSVDSEYLYVLESSQNRVLVYRKTGEFVAQFVSEQFRNAVDLIVRENQNTVLVMTTSELLSFPAQHLLE